MLPTRVQKEPKRASRWKSIAHRDFVRSFACCMCGSQGPREAAHVRIGSGAGMGQKPDDWRVVPLCATVEGCHQHQHQIGEETFWRLYKERHGQTVEQLLGEFVKASPRRAEIERVMKERANAE